MNQEHMVTSYRTYWLAWLCLLGLTLLMVAVGHPAILISGMLVKATIILLWFMHMRYERLEFVLGIILAVVFTSLVLFILIAPDGRAM